MNHGDTVALWGAVGGSIIGCSLAVLGIWLERRIESHRHQRAARRDLEETLRRHNMRSVPVSELPVTSAKDAARKSYVDRRHYNDEEMQEYYSSLHEPSEDYGLWQVTKPTPPVDEVLESRIPELNPYAKFGIMGLHQHPAEAKCSELCSIYDRTAKNNSEESKNAE